MISQAVTIINKLGLHARAATRLVNCAAAASKGTPLSIEAEGMDENQAIEDMIELINNRFGEEE